MHTYIYNITVNYLLPHACPSHNNIPSHYLSAPSHRHFTSSRTHSEELEEDEGEGEGEDEGTASISGRNNLLTYFECVEPRDHHMSQSLQFSLHLYLPPSSPVRLGGGGREAHILITVIVLSHNITDCAFKLSITQKLSGLNRASGFKSGVTFHRAQ